MYRRCDRFETLICHVSLGSPLPIALLAAAVCLSAVLALLIAAVGVMPLSPPGCGSTSRAAVALATVATDTDCEYGPAIRVTANPKPKNSVLVDVHIGHKEIMPSWRRRAHE